MCAIGHEIDTWTLENQTNQKSIFSDSIPDIVHISTIPQHYTVIINLRDQRFLLLFFLLSDCKKISGGRSGGSMAGSDTLAPAQGSHASQALSLKLKEDLSGTGPSLSTAWMPWLLWEKKKRLKWTKAGWSLGWVVGCLRDSLELLTKLWSGRRFQGFFLETEH